MNWEEIERSFGAHFASSRGRPALSPRLVAGLLYLQHANDARDEAVVATWLENPYWQYFCAEACLQTALPIDPSSLSRWRKRIGEEGVEVLLAVTIEAARAAGLIKKSSLDKVIVDTTVMPKVIAHPPIVDCWRKAASTWSSSLMNTICSCARTTTDRLRVWPRRSAATRMPSSLSACAKPSRRSESGWPVFTGKSLASSVNYQSKHRLKRRTCCTAWAAS